MTGATEPPARECAHENRVIDAEADVRTCVDCNATLPRTGVPEKPAKRGVRVTMTDATTGYSETVCLVGLETMSDGAVVEDQWAVLLDALRRSSEDIGEEFGADVDDE